MTTGTNIKAQPLLKPVDPDYDNMSVTCTWLRRKKMLKDYSWTSWK